MLRSLVAMCWLASSLARAEVSISVTAADNLADVADPIPMLGVNNDTKDTIEISEFNGVPFTKYPGPNPAMCGGGFEPHQLAPGQFEMFPLWTHLEAGPGTSGTYQVVLPYQIVRGKRRLDREATSDPFTLAYGDIAPATPTAKPGAVVVVAATNEHNAPPLPTAASVAAKLLPAVTACVTAAQQRLPWLRGRFTLVVYQYNAPAPKLYVSNSVLGDSKVNACLGAIKMNERIPRKVELTYAVSPPL
jgi:hypothetical protein